MSKSKKKENLFPKLPPSVGKGDKPRPKDQEKWDNSEFWKTTKHYKLNPWMYE